MFPSIEPHVSGTLYDATDQYCHSEEYNDEESRRGDGERFFACAALAMIDPKYSRIKSKDHLGSFA